MSNYSESWCLENYTSLEDEFLPSKLIDKLVGSLLTTWRDAEVFWSEILDLQWQKNKLVLFFFFWDRVSVCSPGWPQTPVLMPSPPECWQDKCMPPCLGTSLFLLAFFVLHSCRPFVTAPLVPWEKFTVVVQYCLVILCFLGCTLVI
jgi:hypothetical protein